MMGSPSAGPSIAPSGRGQMASIVETIVNPFTDDTEGFPNVVQKYNFTLAQFPRARSLAPQFQFYRAKKVTWMYEPLYNTFQEGQAGTKPYLYVMMNRTQLDYNAALGLDLLIGSGARAKPFTSMYKITYTPNWCSPGIVAQQSQTAFQNLQVGLQKQYTWLACPASDNASPVDIVDGIQKSSTAGTAPLVAVENNVAYNGHISFVDQFNAPVAQRCYKLTLQVHWEFKGAHFAKSAGTTGITTPI